MKEFVREYPFFSLCGLNCGLCPRHHTEGDSKCPGCGGTDFHLKHPSCSVITCNRKHDNVEYCFQCSKYPCEKYKNQGEVDSFITYQNVLSDFDKASSEGLPKYKAVLNRKVEILNFLINNCNEGRRKSFYCLAVNLIKVEDLDDILNVVNTNDTISEKAEKMVSLLLEKAKKDNIKLELRK